MADFAAVIAKERERLGTMRQDALARRSTIDSEIADIDKELRAITAYESAKSGSRKGKSTRHGSRQDGVLQLLKDAPDGMSRSDILDRLGLKGNKSGEQSISNALSTMKKAGKIGAKDGRYVLA